MDRGVQVWRDGTPGCVSRNHLNNAGASLVPQPVIAAVEGHLRWEAEYDPRCRLVAVTWVPTNSGLVQPVEAVGEVCETLGVPYLIDACQAVGQIPIDVARLGCDFLAATARKFLRGPRGIGFLYVSDRALARGAYPLLVDMRGANWIKADEFELNCPACGSWTGAGSCARSSPRRAEPGTPRRSCWRSLLRVSPHYYNTRDEIDAAVAAIGELLREASA